MISKHYKDDKIGKMLIYCYFNKHSTIPLFWFRCRGLCNIARKSEFFKFSKSLIKLTRHIIYGLISFLTTIENFNFIYVAANLTLQTLQKIHAMSTTQIGNAEEWFLDVSIVCFTLLKLNMFYTSPADGMHVCMQQISPTPTLTFNLPFITCR